MVKYYLDTAPAWLALVKFVLMLLHLPLQLRPVLERSPASPVPHCHVHGFSHLVATMLNTLKLPVWTSQVQHKRGNSFSVVFLCGTSRRQQASNPTRTVPSPTSDEKNTLLKEISNANPKAAVLSVHPDYFQSFVSEVDMPELLSGLYCENNTKLSDEEMGDLVETVFQRLSVSEAQVENVEMLTRKQSQSKTWFAHRAGRITASKLKSVCATTVQNPSQSLVKSICYPATHSFKTKATEWGCQHEKTALHVYEEK